ncbi:hypothetical protein [Pseudothauera rhizosphaerae]|uniref:hypothetical protein n=1 Tax=Pseudothauera rhizosphaerae TaxID=2565932 RepID=UPI001454CD7F|nr:hypothetical protein [Pseudothauera rhizosphaerae]
MPAAVDTLLDGLAAALRAHIDPERGLLDPIRQAPTPPDHYGNTAAALALFVRGADDWPRARQALQAWITTDDARLGHLPFNRLLLVLLAQVMEQRRADASELGQVRAAIRRCRLRATYPSNNWTLLAQTCRLLEAPPDRRERESARLCKLFERWTTPAGGFIDFPERPTEHLATPLAYHHKALFLAALASRFHDAPALADHARRLLDWAARSWNPAGYAGGLGRSNHALFGDACLLAAMLLLGVHESAPESVAALATRLSAQRRPDGLLWLTPGGAQSGTASWDGYMHLSVYNAWAAAVVGMACHLAALKPRTGDFIWRKPDPGCFHDAQAGLLSWHSPRGTHALLTTRGQPPQSFSRNAADLRYAGGVILHLAGTDGAPRVPPPLRLKKANLLANPALAGWTPIFDVAGELHALSDFDTVTVTPLEDGVRIELEGQPRIVFRPPARSLLERAISALDWRLFHGRFGRHASLHRKAAAGLRARLSLDVSDAPVLRIASTLEIAAAPDASAIYLNPLGHALTAPLPAASGIRCTPFHSSLPDGHACAGEPIALQAGTQSWSFVLPLGAAHPELDAEHPGVPPCSP